MSEFTPFQTWLRLFHLVQVVICRQIFCRVKFLRSVTKFRKCLVFITYLFVRWHIFTVFRINMLLWELLKMNNVFSKKGVIKNSHPCWSSSARDKLTTIGSWVQLSVGQSGSQYSENTMFIWQRKPSSGIYPGCLLHNAAIR